MTLVGVGVGPFWAAQEREAQYVVFGVVTVFASR